MNTPRKKPTQKAAKAARANRPSASTSARPTKPSVPSAAAKPTENSDKPAVVPEQRAGRPSLSPRERASRPVTATIASYVEWLDKTVFDGKMSVPQKMAAGVAITLYGRYQVSPERRAIRDGQ